MRDCSFVRDDDQLHQQMGDESTRDLLSPKLRNCSIPLSRDLLSPKLWNFSGPISLQNVSATV